MTTFIKSKAVKAVVGLLALAVFAIGAHSASAAYTFTQALKMGSNNAEVMQLQKTLNANGFTVATSGAGSAGMESTYFGAKTAAAVTAFQTAKGISSIGSVGPLTRAALNTLSGSMMSYPAGCTSATGYSTTTGMSCASGSMMSYPAGCTTAAGFSVTTGLKCDGTQGGGMQQGSGPVTVSLSSDNPASAIIINGQATADLAHFAFSGNGTVTSVTITRSGISDQNTLQNLYLYDGATRLTDGYSFNSVGNIVINGLNITVSGTKVISVKADVSSTASTGTIGVALTSYMISGSTTAMKASVAGNTMSVTSATGILASATLSANTVTGSPTVNAGTTSYVFWSAPLQVNTRTVALKVANFRMIGSAPSDALSNLKMYVDGVDTGKVASITMTNGSNYATFDFTAAPFSLTTGSHTLDVRGDIQKGSNRNVQFSIQNASDLMIMDPQVGVNLAIGGTVPNNAASISISTGSVTVVLDPSFQAMTNITGGASNVAIGKFKVHAYGEDVKVQSLSVTPSFPVAPTGVAGLQNVTLYFNGSQVGSQVSGWTSGPLTFQLGSQLIIPAGQDSTLEVRADIRTTTGINYTDGSVRVAINTGSSNAQGQNSQNTVNFPGATILGNTLSVQTGLLAVSKNTGYANQNVNPNTASVKISSFVLQNQSSSESVRVTSLKIDLTGTSALTNLAALKTSETSGNASTPVQPQGSNTFSTDFTLAPGATKTIDIFADTGSTSGVTVISTLTVSSIGVSSNVASTSAATAGQTVTLAVGTITNPPSLLTASATTAQYVAAANGGATNATKATFNLAATGGSATISEMEIAVTGTNTVTSVTVGGVTAPVVGGVAYFNGGLSLTVPNGGSGLNQDVFVNYSEVGVNGVASGTSSTISLVYVKYTSGGTTSTLGTSGACTALTGSTCTATLGAAIAAPTMVVVGSKPTVSAMKPSTTVSNGLVEAIDVTVAADAKGNITLNTLPITVTPSGAMLTTGTNTIVVKDSNNTTVATTNTAFVATGSTSVITFTGGYTIQGSSSQTFKIFVLVNSATPTGVNTVSLSSSTATGSSFTWTDTAGNAGSAQTGTTLLPSYPSTFTSVLYN
jgi:hypothetical protein